MKRFGKHCMIFIVLMFILGITGCTLIEVIPEKDRQRVVAEVYGEKILKGEFLDAYNQQKAFYGITEEIEKDSQYKDTIKEIKKDVLDQLITRRVLQKRAKQAGFTVNEEYIQEARKELEEQLKSYAEALKQRAQSKGKESQQEKDYLQKARNEWRQQLSDAGLTEEEYIRRRAENIMLEKFTEKMLEDVEVTEQDIQQYYNEQLNKQKEDPSLVETAPVQLYRPAGWVRVKQILISLSSEERDEYYNLIQQGKQDEAKKYLEEKLKAIEPRAREVYDKAKAGESFEALIEAYSDDKSTANKEEGYVIYKGSGMFAEEVEKAALKLNEGEISEPVSSPLGYHIIKLYEKLPEKVFSLEEKKEEIKEVVLNDKRNEKWNALLEEWKKEAKIKKYESRL
ncbi:peptidylprolyl isomerase [Caldicoprobacter faecalis]|uniref:peptidylprolyl isomerase n=1 Tax=Caldicoprobacter faecalis TaxID=937334 RepID=A0A1I5XB84_9FIRM|nr:peptidylprolyl isomerase [Caldicoprobacter faecalis]SFQ29239.1 peptidyl-prolyl cis-trans isomerase C/foldase protein PrsA [Caldicoprobacter faecalis]